MPSLIYLTGKQYPDNLKLRPKTSLSNTLTKCREIEIIAAYPKAYRAKCHACAIEWPKTEAKSLERHVASSKHQDSLTGVSIVERKRSAILNNPKFSFLVSNEDRVSCKFCSMQLSFNSSKLHAHLNSKYHQEAVSKANNEPFSTNLNDRERLSRLQSLAREFQNIALVSEIDYAIHCQIFESHKGSKQTLHINDIYCTCCRRKFERSSINGYRSAIKEHNNTAQHQKRINKPSLIVNSTFSLIRPPKSPIKKISPYKHDPEDLKELARHVSTTNLSSSQVGTSLRRITSALIHRSASWSGLKRGYRLLSQGKQ